MLYFRFCGSCKLPQVVVVKDEVVEVVVVVEGVVEVVVVEVLDVADELEDVEVSISFDETVGNVSTGERVLELDDSGNVRFRSGKFVHLIRFSVSGCGGGLSFSSADYIKSLAERMPMDYVILRCISFSSVVP
jgi:hypothetical protein